MNKKELEFLRSKRFVIGVPVVVKFQINDKKKPFKFFKATKGTEVVRWSDILKTRRERRK